jgi:hypothetical protein
MGMTGGLYRASPVEIQRLVNEPETIEAFVEASAWAPPVREVRAPGIFGWLMRLLPVKVFENDPDAEPPPGYNEADDRPHCDLEGAWHGLHFLFTGTAWEGDEPACYLLRGGEAIGDAEEAGYTVLQALGPAKLQQFAAFLRGLSRDELERRYNPTRMMELQIDPQHWEHTLESVDRPLDHLLNSYDNLLAFATDTAEADAGAVVYVT